MKKDIKKPKLMFKIFIVGAFAFALGFTWISSMETQTSKAAISISINDLTKAQTALGECGTVGSHWSIGCVFQSGVCACKWSGSSCASYRVCSDGAACQNGGNC